jgi:hypothetical protein
MVKSVNIKKRSPMNISIASRLLGVAITMFVLILTIKSDLLNKDIIILQLALCIPFLLVSMITNAKIVDLDSLKDYYLPNRIANSIGISLIINTIGLLVANYTARYIGILFFILLILLLGCLIYLDFNKRKLYNEVLMIALIFFFGLLPSILGL